MGITNRYYCSPEVLNDERYVVVHLFVLQFVSYTFSADMWSIGVILYELMSFPFFSYLFYILFSHHFFFFLNFLHPDILYVYCSPPTPFLPALKPAFSPRLADMQFIVANQYDPVDPSLGYSKGMVQFVYALLSLVCVRACM